MKRALILVDIQNDFCPGGALPVTEGDRIIPVVNLLQDQFELIVATQDWHPAHHESFAAQHQGKNPGEVIELHGLTQVLWPIHCVQGSEGAAFVKSLNVAKVTKIFQKGTDQTIDSYSGFFDNGKRKATGLGDYLRQQGVSDVYIVGLATDYCVKFTALDANKLGFKTYLIEDACRGVNLSPYDAYNAVQDMKTAGITIIQSADVLN